MTEQTKVPQKPTTSNVTHNGAIGNDPFADMQPIEWLEIAEKPQIGAPTFPPQPTSPPIIKIQDEADVALMLWLNEDKDEDLPPTPAIATPAPRAENDLLDWLWTKAQKENAPASGGVTNTQA